MQGGCVAPDPAMTRPIVWATGTLVAVALSASFAGDRFAHLASGLRPAGGRAATSEPAPPAPARQVSAGRSVTIEGDRLGHFQAEASIDGRHIRLMVDTGASVVALTHEDAAAAGFRPFPSDFSRKVATANGEVAVAPIRIREMRVGDITVRDVDAVVVPKGLLGTSLLGMSFLNRLGSFDIGRGRLTLRG